jgi:exopolysaccharide production protein ExoQ
MATLALLCISILVVILLRIEYKQSPATSYSLWLPTGWIMICGSRPVGRWFEAGIDNKAGSPMDQLVLTILLILALLTLYRRKIRWSTILKDNAWLILLFVYMASSVLWSDFPFVSFKRWIRVAGSLLMAALILTENRPREALESIMRRSSYVLIPFSLVLVRYFPQFGRLYGRWDGVEMWTGVATHKNSLGQLCAISLIFLFWALLLRAKSGTFFRGGSLVYADLLVSLIALFLLIGPGHGAYSATAIAVTILSIGIIYGLNRYKNLAIFVGSNLIVLLVGSVLFYILFADAITETIADLLGRNKNLTGRATDIWPVVLDTASRNPILGVGYGAAWGLGREISARVEVEQAHNGYLDIYLQLGMTGVVLLVAFLFSFCSAVRKEMNGNSHWGIYGISILIISLIYNNSESSFIEYTSYLWNIMVYIAIVFSAPYSAIQETGPESHRSRPQRFRYKVTQAPLHDEWEPVPERRASTMKAKQRTF